MKEINKKVLKLIYISLLVIVISTFSSCNADKTPDYAKNALTYINFSADTSRTLTIGYNPASYSSLYWFYKAEKEDGYGTVGETKEWTPILTPVTSEEKPNAGLSSDYIGPFSQGEWNFFLIAYKEASETETTDAVSYTYSYKGTSDNGTWEETTKTFYFTTPIYESGTISETLENEKETIAATVDTVEGVGTLALSSLGFESADNLTTASMTLTRQDKTTENPLSKTLTISENGRRYSITSVTYSDIPSGTYECKIQATGEKSASFTSTFYFSIYTGTTTTLSRELVEDT